MNAGLRERIFALILGINNEFTDFKGVICEFVVEILVLGYRKLTVHEYDRKFRTVQLEMNSLISHTWLSLLATNLFDSETKPLP